MNEHYTEDELQTMTVAQMREFANGMGVQIKSNASKDEVVQTILDAQAGFMPEEAMSDVEKTSASIEGDPGERIEIMVNSGGGPEGEQPVKVGLNGRSYLIKRDEWVRVPRAVTGILDAAVTTVLEEAGVEPDGTIKHRERDVRRYTYQTR